MIRCLGSDLMQVKCDMVGFLEIRFSFFFLQVDITYFSWTLINKINLQDWEWKKKKNSQPENAVIHTMFTCDFFFIVRFYCTFGNSGKKISIWFNNHNSSGFLCPVIYFEYKIF